MMNTNEFKRMIKHKLARYSYISSVFPEELENIILNRVSEEELRHFVNSSNGLLSPNTYIENLVFVSVCNFLYHEYKDFILFEKDAKLDVKTIIATSLSSIQRPDLKIPSKVIQSFSEPLYNDEFIRIARFERELVPTYSCEKNRVQGSIVFEGLLPDKMEKNPLIDTFPTHHIWTGSFLDKPAIQGLCTNIYSIESSNVLWMNSDLLSMLDLMLDDHKNGLRALNKNGEIILKFRQWKDQLINKGSSFVGTNANIAKLEGCDLVLRNDYFDKLKEIIPSLVFYSYVINYPKII